MIAGSVQVPEEIHRRDGIELALATAKPGMPLGEAIGRAEELLDAAARELAGRIVT